MQKRNIMGYIYIALTIIFTVYGQLIIKSQVEGAGEFPEPAGEKLLFIMQLLLNPLVLSGLSAAFLASLAWIATLTQFDLNYAYPFTSLTFVVVMIASTVLFNEPLSHQKIIGTTIIILGLVIVSR